MKKLIALIAIVALIGLMLGCTAPDANDTNTPPTDNQPEVSGDLVENDIDNSIVNETEEIDVGEMI